MVFNDRMGTLSPNAPPVGRLLAWRLHRDHVNVLRGQHERQHGSDVLRRERRRLSNTRSLDLPGDINNRHNLELHVLAGRLGRVNIHILRPVLFLSRMEPWNIEFSVAVQASQRLRRLRGMDTRRQCSLQYLLRRFWLSDRNTRGHKIITGELIGYPESIHEADYNQLWQKAERIDIKINDATGRLIKTLYQESKIENQASYIVWSGDDDSGKKLPAGVYLCCFKTANHMAIEKVIKAD